MPTSATQFERDLEDRYGEPFNLCWVHGYDAYDINFSEGHLRITGSIMKLYETNPEAFWTALDNEISALRGV